MRRTVGLILCGLGAFLIVTALLLRLYAYPSLAKAPLDQYTTTVSFGPGATVFDISSLSEVQTDLTSTRITRGDVEASDDDVAVYDTFVNTTNSAGTTLSAMTERAAFGRTDGLAVRGFGENIDGDPVVHEGLIFKFPFDTQRQDYPFWDYTVRKAFPAKFSGEEELEGVAVYRFVQTIPATVIASLDVPGSLVDADEATVSVDRVYENTRTLWVEPNTGVILKGQEEQYARFQYEGEDKVTATEVTIAYNDDTVRMLADEYGPKGRQLDLVRNAAPLWAGLLGVVVLGVGLVLVWSHRRERADESEYAEPEPAARY
jgi:hypothetical protein